MKICILPAAYKPIPPTKGGAVETIVQNFININERTGNVEFTVLSVKETEAQNISTNYKHTKIIFFDGFEKIDRMYYWCFYKVFKKFFNIILPDYILKFKMVKWLHKNQNCFDWILVEAGEIDCFKFYEKYLDVNKIIYHSHGEIKNKKRVEKSIHYYMAVSDFVKNTWLNSYPSSINDAITLKNGINQDKFRIALDENIREEQRENFGFSCNDIVILFVGRIIPEKGVLELLNAMSCLPSNYKLLMIGSSSFGTKTHTKYEKKVERKINELSNRVAFTGYVPNNEIGKFYKLADISAIPSIFEDPAPLVVMEAMASGLPIVTTGSGGIKEYCDSSCALFVNRDKDISSNFAKNIMKLGENKTLRLAMGMKANYKAKEFTDANQYRHLVNELNYLTRKEE